MPNALSQSGGYALGAQAGGAAIRQLVTDAGFTRFRRAAPDALQHRLRSPPLTRPDRHSMVEMTLSDLDGAQDQHEPICRLQSRPVTRRLRGTIIRRRDGKLAWLLAEAQLRSVPAKIADDKADELSATDSHPLARQRRQAQMRLGKRARSPGAGTSG